MSSSLRRRRRRGRRRAAGRGRLRLAARPEPLEPARSGSDDRIRAEPPEQEAEHLRPQRAPLGRGGERDLQSAAEGGGRGALRHRRQRLGAASAAARSRIARCSGLHFASAPVEPTTASTRGDGAGYPGRVRVDRELVAGAGKRLGVVGEAGLRTAVCAASGVEGERAGAEHRTAQRAWPATSRRGGGAPAKSAGVASGFRKPNGRSSPSGTEREPSDEIAAKPLSRRFATGGDARAASGGVATTNGACMPAALQRPRPFEGVAGITPSCTSPRRTARIASASISAAVAGPRRAGHERRQRRRSRRAGARRPAGRRRRRCGRPAFPT